MIRIVCVGRIRGALADASSDYEQRLRRTVKLDVVEVREEPLRGRSEAEVRRREMTRIVPHLAGFVVVCLDRTGRSVDSELLAARVEAWECTPPQRTAFVVGGTLGLDPSLLDQASHTLSLGSLTLPHQLARVVLMEQLYRSFAIRRGAAYHHAEPAAEPTISA